MSSPKTDTTLDLSLSGRASEDTASAPSEAAAAVLRLFDESATPLLRYLNSFGIGAAAAEDVRQDVFLSLFRHLKMERPRHNLKGWLFRVAHNLALKQRQQQARQRRTAAEWEIASQDLDPAENPEQRLLADQRRERLQAVVQGMPERDRQCLTLRAEGLCYREIAKVLDISLGSVAKSLTRAMTRLTVIDEGQDHA